MKVYEYGEEQLLLIGDWYHYSAEEVQASYLTFMSSGHEVVSSVKWHVPWTLLMTLKASSRLPSYQRHGNV
jgi:hypothetical protein